MKFVQCCNQLDDDTSDSSQAASGIKQILKDSEFQFWLHFFSQIMLQMDILFNQLQ